LTDNLPLVLKLHELYSADSQKSHEMSDFKAKMHQIRFRLGLRPRPRWGSLGLQRSPDPLDGFEGPTSKGGEEKRGRDERGGDGAEGRGWGGKRGGEGGEGKGEGREDKGEERRPFW